MEDALGIVAPAGGYIKVEGMQEFRSINAFSFLGRYRLIDFPVSNLSNSGIERVQVYVTSENPRSLAEHVGNGRIYNINSKRGRLEMMFSRESVLSDIYNTDVKAYLDNLPIIERCPQKYVIITPGYMVFKQNFDQLLKAHIDSGADISLLYHKTSHADTCYRNCYTLELNRQKGFKSMRINTGIEAEKNIFMDTYIMTRELFMELIVKAKKLSSISRLTNIIDAESEELDIRGIQHKGFFAAITDFKAYFDANMHLLDMNIANSLFTDDWPIYTHTTDSCPVRYRPGASVKKTMVANGCVIEGSVENSVIGRGVEIKKGSVVKNCVIMGHSEIGENVRLENVVVDKWAKVKDNNKIVFSEDKPGYIKRMDII
ncbi:glucose-1-phosphate adenylyltransferase subunit GlgD [Butyrivibrio sp. MC2013]|uniref:glucose-1-phosphate adenylyltransferase subunit GlgD n=1 Tax=Butyrivibrio sp. MC2013 TaxID=1280686 RepID=UPI00040D68FF|nr:glucose-1-phosphate adenylyltransferase subunit GlgD [Butyrivibrio sp. MC2013]